MKALRPLLLLSALLFSQVDSPAAPAKPTPAKAPTPSVGLETGEIGGAKFAIIRPVFWNRRVLLLAHGWRPETSPLAAELTLTELPYRTLVDEGWMVATTSFRRNGTIVAEGMQDLDALLNYINEKFGGADRVLVEGESMGGLIATLIAERTRDQYTGVVAVAPTLQSLEPASGVGLTMQPKIPLLFLVNQTEIDAPKAYITSKLAAADASMQPALFLVARDGHDNVNQREKLAALRALNAWIDDGRTTLPHPVKPQVFYDATVVPEPTASRVVMRKNHIGFETQVLAIDPVYGNIIVNAQPLDFTTVGITRGFRFKVTAHGNTYRTLYGRDYGTVKSGEWVAFPSADGAFILSRNRQSAAASTGTKVGDTIVIESYGVPDDA